jgi:hypothetical protein
MLRRPCGNGPVASDASRLSWRAVCGMTVSSRRRCRCIKIQSGGVVRRTVDGGLLGSPTTSWARDNRAPTRRSGRSAIRWGCFDPGAQNWLVWLVLRSRSQRHPVTSGWRGSDALVAAFRIELIQSLIGLGEGVGDGLFPVHLRAASAELPGSLFSQRCRHNRVDHLIGPRRLNHVGLRGTLDDRGRIWTVAASAPARMERAGPIRTRSPPQRRPRMAPRPSSRAAVTSPTRNAIPVALPRSNALS